MTFFILAFLVCFWDMEAIFYKAKIYCFLSQLLMKGKGKDVSKCIKIHGKEFCLKNSSMLLSMNDLKAKYMKY